MVDPSINKNDLVLLDKIDYFLEIERELDLNCAWRIEILVVVGEELLEEQLLVQAAMRLIYGERCCYCRQNGKGDEKSDHVRIVVLKMMSIAADFHRYY